MLIMDGEKSNTVENILKVTFTRSLPWGQITKVIRRSAETIKVSDFTVDRQNGTKRTQIENLQSKKVWIGD